MSFHAAFLVVGLALIFAWLLGALAPALSRGPTAIASSALLLALAAEVLFGSIHYRLFYVNGEYSLAIGILAWIYLVVGTMGLTLGLLIRAKLKPFGLIEEGTG